VKQRPMYVIGDLRGFEEEGGERAHDYLTQSTSRAAAIPPEPSFDR